MKKSHDIYICPQQRIHFAVSQISQLEFILKCFFLGGKMSVDQLLTHALFDSAFYVP